MCFPPQRVDLPFHPNTAEAGEGQAGKPRTESAGPRVAANFTKDHEQGQ